MPDGTEPGMDAFTVAGKVAIVTGAGGGIGQGIVELLARSGAKVMATARRAECESAIRYGAPDAAFLAADLSDTEQLARIVPHAVEAFGRVDILVNNAALIDAAPLEAHTPEFIDRQAAVNLRAPLLLCRDFASQCRRQGSGGKIINVGSIEGLVATMPLGLAAYSATKTAVAGLTVTLARELGPDGICVNAVSPGGVVHGNQGHTGTDEVLEGIRARGNVGRLGTPMDIARVVVFLASPASDFVSGQTIVADGGYTVG